MTIYIALLRGINVGGNKRIKMADLRDLFASIGLEGAKTLLASGNLVCQSDETERNRLRTLMEETIEGHYGFEVKVILRTATELDAIIAKNPFDGDEIEGNKLLVTFFHEAPSDDAIADFVQSHATVEQLHFSGDELFTYYPDGMSKSKLTNNLIQTQFGVISTARNWNTLLKIQALAQKMTS